LQWINTGDNDIFKTTKGTFVRYEDMIAVDISNFLYLPYNSSLESDLFFIFAHIICFLLSEREKSERKYIGETFQDKHTHTQMHKKW
jgi:hypothetical protein